jgi:DNA-binding SARP family transcriptional activator
MRDAIGTVLAPCERRQHERTVAAARTVLGEAAFLAARELGLRAPDPDEAVDDQAPGDQAPEKPVHATPATAAMPVLAALVPVHRKAATAPVPDTSTASAASAARAEVSSLLTVRALGTASVRLGDVELTAADWGYAKPRELLFLIVTSPPRTREQLGAALWPELSRQHLGNALHTALRELRRALGDPDWVIYSGGKYSFNRARPHACDVDEFESALALAGRARLAGGRPASGQATDPGAGGGPLSHLQRAVAAYQGDFLDGVAVGEWAHARREELRRRFESALLALGRLHADAGHLQLAVTAFRRAIEHEPLNESAHRELMSCWDGLGETARAVRHYGELEALLADQVGVRPAPETVALYKRLAGPG